MIHVDPSAESVMSRERMVKVRAAFERSSASKSDGCSHDPDDGANATNSLGFLAVCVQGANPPWAGMNCRRKPRCGRDEYVIMLA